MAAAPLSLELMNKLRSLAQTPILLVATDYDGTLAPIVDDPLQARPLRESSVALRSLAVLANTHVSIISGRALRDLAALSRFPEEIHLVGSHGSEFDIGFVENLTSENLQQLDSIQSGFEAIAKQHEGVFLEIKPASVALHYRRCASDIHEEVAAQAQAVLDDISGVQLKLGKLVVEALVVQHNKGTALDRLRHRLAAEAVLFLGDDTTDEEAFARLTGPDVGIKVGDGDTLAQFRVADPEEVAEVLGFLSEEREKWVQGGGFPAIKNLSFLSNGQTTAVLTESANVVWLCHPRPDSAAVFADLLGGAGAGSFSVRPDIDASATDASATDASQSSNGQQVSNGQQNKPLRQRYVDNTLSVETAWENMQVVDFLEQSACTLHRVLTGEGAAVVEFVPRPDFGRSHPLLELTEDGIIVTGGVDHMALRAPGVIWTSLRGGRAVGRVELSREEPVELELRLGSNDLSPAPVSSVVVKEMTEAHWEHWADKLVLPQRYTEIVRRSALTLKGLCYDPTGAVLAAATTSLPEEIGGVRNWDYRYCWPRDAAMTVQALVLLGSTKEAVDFMEWLSRRLEDIPSPDLLRPLYPVEGDMSAPEAVITTLSGYRGSRPVRVGNAAANQAQHDIFGSVLDLLWHLVSAGAWHGPGEDTAGGVALRGNTWATVEAMAAAVEHLWELPDHGTWEERQPPRHHVHSKVMCWVALDRAIKVGRVIGKAAGEAAAGVSGAGAAGAGGAAGAAGDAAASVAAAGATEEKLEHWQTIADRIRAEVAERGWNEKVGAYTVAYDDDFLDAAVLLMGLYGMVEPTDERYMATVDLVEQRLRLGPIVYRYRFDDGLPGFEGGFFICACWLVEALHQVGRVEEAESLFEEILSKLGPTGLLAEQYDPATRRQLGNFPQAYSHLGVINAALRLTGAKDAPGYD